MKKHLLHEFHLGARPPVPTHPHGHKNGAKVAGVVMMPGNDGAFGILAVKRESGNRVWWELPGGSMEPVDTGSQEKAITREILEETGVYARPVFAMHDLPYKTPRGRTVHTHWCEYVSGQPQNVAADEHLEVAVLVPDDFEIKVENNQKRAYARGIDVQMPLALVEGLLKGRHPAPAMQPELKV